MTRFVLVPVAAACLALAACNPAESDPAPGGVTVSEAEALDDAAEMIEQRRLPDGAIATEGESEVTAEPVAESGEVAQ